VTHPCAKIKTGNGVACIVRARKVFFIHGVLTKMTAIPGITYRTKFFKQIECHMQKVRRI